MSTKKRSSVHEAHPSVAALAQRSKVTKYDGLKPGSIEHESKPSVGALDEAQMVDKGIKYWTEREGFDHPSVEWWQLKCAKDFKRGMGETLHRGGTLSTWSEAEVSALIKDMESTLKLAAPGQSVIIHPSSAITSDADGGALATSDGSAAGAVVDPESIDPSLKDALDAQFDRVRLDPETAGDDALATADWEKPSSSSTSGGKKKKRGKKGGATGDGSTDEDHVRLVTLLDLQQYVADQKALESDSVEAGGADTSGGGTGGSSSMLSEAALGQSKAAHRRTATAALRGQLTEMTKRLHALEQDFDAEHAEKVAAEEELMDATVKHAMAETKLAKLDAMRFELASTRGALLAAEDELSMSEELVIEQSQQILNLQRELAISKELCQTFTSKIEAKKAEGATDADGTVTLTMEDLLDQRMKDAQRFAIMIGAMQEQLEFERGQFTARITGLEKELENKDGQINVLYQLYNQLVEAHRKETTKSWFTRVRESVMGE